MAKLEDKTRQPINVVKTYAGLDEYLTCFRDGKINFMVLIGSYGTGKSRLVRQALGERAGWIEGIATAFAIYSLTYRYLDRPIVLDDIDAIYTNKQCVSLLKSLCRSEKTKLVAWNARNGWLEREGLPKEFTTESPVMVICNEWKSLSKNIEALEDRAVVVSFEPSVQEIHRQAGTWFEDREIYDWFAGQLRRIGTHSFRSYVKAAQLKSGGINWKKASVRTSKKDEKEILADELINDDSFSGNEDRARAFTHRGGGSRGTFYFYRRKLLGLNVPVEPPPRKVGRPRKEV
jgi:hypothetical protein